MAVRREPTEDWSRDGWLERQAGGAEAGRGRDRTGQDEMGPGVHPPGGQRTDCGPDEERWPNTRGRNRDERQGTADQTESDGRAKNAEPGCKLRTRVRSPPPRREAQGRNEVYEGNAFWNKDLNKAYSIYKKKRLEKKGKLFEEKEEASLYTGIITLLINPDNVTEKTGEAERERDEERTGEERRQERTGKTETGNGSEERQG
ncbi:hypothetical protein DFP73DRAFT_590150 [Morchella snyderi]|nr:hypothetical protein DFP73DRAFT_590150 [Morchella snyderi]